jgi:type I restriction enzyme S subunit
VKKISRFWGTLWDSGDSVPRSCKSRQSPTRTEEKMKKAETQKLEAIYQQKLLNLVELKKSVLQKAFAGELTTEKE